MHSPCPLLSLLRSQSSKYLTLLLQPRAAHQGPCRPPQHAVQLPFALEPVAPTGAHDNWVIFGLTKNKRILHDKARLSRKHVVPATSRSRMLICFTNLVFEGELLPSLLLHCSYLGQHLSRRLQMSPDVKRTQRVVSMLELSLRRKKNPQSTKRVRPSRHRTAQFTTSQRQVQYSSIGPATTHTMYS